MNTDQLKEIICDIYQDFEPLAHMNQQLFNHQTQDEIKNITKIKTHNLDAESKTRIEHEIFGWGPLEKIKEQEDIFDIIIQGPENIFYETSLGIRKLNDQFLSPTSFQNFCEELFKKADVLVSHKEPFGNGSYNSFRVHVVIPPITQEINITLRKHQAKVIPMQSLLDHSFFKTDQLSLIEEILSTQKNFLVIGPTGCGKTTLLNSMIHSLCQKQRIVAIEDTDELKLNGHLSTKLLSREVCPENLNKISMEDLVKQALRMRPDRIVVGEVRGQEAKDLLQALATGHSGSIGTLHAQNAQQAIYRLEMLIQMGAPQWEIQSIRRLIQMSLDYLIVLNEDRYNKGVEGIYKIASMEKFGLLFNKEC